MNEGASLGDGIDRVGRSQGGLLPATSRRVHAPARGVSRHALRDALASACALAVVAAAGPARAEPGPPPGALAGPLRVAPLDDGRSSPTTQAAPRLATTLSFRAHAPADESPAVIPLGRPRTRVAAHAFASELREEAERYRDSSPWALAPAPMLDDDGVREHRAKAARRCLEDAAEAALEALVTRRADGAAKAAMLGSATRSGFRIDGTPSYTIRKRTSGSSMRFDVPLTLSAFRFHCWRTCGGDGGPERLGTTVSVDPWDESARVAFTIGF